MEIKDILDSICGRNELNNSSKAMTGCYLYEMDLNGENIKDISSSITYMPEVYLYPAGNFIQIDIVFSSDGDSDFYKMNQMLAKRLELERDNPNSRYMVVFNFLPANADKGDTGYFEVFNPLMHCLTAIAPKSPVSTLRMLLEAEHVQFYESEDFDATNTNIEVNYEMRLRDEAIRRDKERKAEAEERIKHFEEIRKKNNYNI